ncbi:MAG TPA: secretin N-terminal domain-containing protein, partial [Gemmataceae bacterium]|nr:secretin N-terminal domain-containing protein [Gemmataceae bacterium]
MSRFRFARAAGLIAVLGLAAPAAPGQESEKRPPAKSDSGPQALRRVYAVRAASAKELAEALTLHFQAEPAFRAVPGAESNTLLLSGPKAALEDAAAALREIDRPARTVHVEVLCIELTAKAGGAAGGDGKPLDRAELSGTAREVRAKLRDLRQKGVIGSVKSVELTGLAGQSTRARVSESRPFTTGVSFGGPGGFPGRGGAGGRGGPGGGAGTTARSVTYRDVGISVQVKPEV